jgi:C-terminal processing protease CtpA/Prc
MKISNTPPHHVLSVTELMDETGTIVNDAVGLGDELTAIDRVPVRSMPVGHVVKHVAGPAGTMVHLTFRNPRTEENYSITAQRHVSLAAKYASGSSTTADMAAAGTPPPPPARPGTGALEASAPGPIQQASFCLQ